MNLWKPPIPRLAALKYEAREQPYLPALARPTKREFTQCRQRFSSFLTLSENVGAVRREGTMNEHPKQKVRSLEQKADVVTIGGAFG